MPCAKRKWRAGLKGMASFAKLLQSQGGSVGSLPVQHTKPAGRAAKGGDVVGGALSGKAAKAPAQTAAKGGGKGKSKLSLRQMVGKGLR
jgi:hypothetical protein